LHYDYEYQQWSTFMNHTGLDAAVIGGVYHYLRSDGRVFAETIGQYADAGAFIPMRIDTAWIKLAGYLQGFQKILWMYPIGNYISQHKLSIRFNLDYGAAWTPPIILDPNADYNPTTYGGGPYGGGTYGDSPGSNDLTYQKYIHINRRCQSIQFRIEDIPVNVTTTTPAVAAKQTVPLTNSLTVLQVNTPGAAGNSISIVCV